MSMNVDKSADREAVLDEAVATSGEKRGREEEDAQGSDPADRVVKRTKSDNPNLFYKQYSNSSQYEGPCELPFIFAWAYGRLEQVEKDARNSNLLTSEFTRRIDLAVEFQSLCMDVVKEMRKCVHKTAK